MKATVILNPYAGRWQAIKRRPEVETALKMAGIDYELLVTQAPGHGTELAARAVQNGAPLIISAGGDGSISEVVNGMMLSANSSNFDRLPPFGIIPLGSANDLVVNLKLSTELNEAAKIIAQGDIKKMDLGEVNGRYFDNNSAIGLEPTITLIQQRITWLHGVIRYLVATLLGIYKNPHWNVQIEWEGGSYAGPSTLVTVGNNPLTGGLFYMTPHANPFDGLLTFVHGYMATRIQTLQLLPRTMKPGIGSYVEHPNIHEFHSPWLKIHSKSPTPMHADGEIQSEAIQDINYRIIPSILPIIVK